jgi:hypothetical protein
MNTNDFSDIRIEFNLDIVQDHHVNLNTGEIFGSGRHITIKTLNKCYSEINEEFKIDVIDLVEISNDIIKNQIIERKDIIKNLNKDIELYTWKLSVHNLYLTFLKEKHKAIKSWLKEKALQLNKNDNSKTMANDSIITKKISVKPIFKEESIDEIYILLKDHFDKQQHIQLKNLLKTGNNSNDKLIFLGNGNRLPDAFKQLYDTDFITGCKKNEIEKWVLDNFQYLNIKNEAQSYSPRYLNDIISSNKDNCKKPILEVIKLNGDFQIRKT